MGISSPIRMPEGGFELAQPAELTRDLAAKQIAALLGRKRGFALDERTTYTHEGAVPVVRWRCQCGSSEWCGSSLQELVRLMELEAEIAKIKCRPFG